MDPLTQGLLGATAVANSRIAKAPRGAALGLGFLGGMAADLDVLIRSSSDPLLFLEFHRQFTHSLVFIPLGGILCGLVLHALFAKRKGFSRWQSILFCTLGYATHALLDACTTYGTQLYWPFSNERVSWNIMSIVDPLYTLPIALLLGISLSLQRAWLARIALFWVFAYPTIGWWQRDRAESIGRELAASRQHQVLSLSAKPSFANLLLWKVIYRTPDAFYVDAVRMGIKPKVIEGAAVAPLDIPRDLPWLQAGSQQAIDLERFRWFSQDYIALAADNSHRVIDLRYSLLPNEIEALWSIELSPSNSEQHVRYITQRGDSRAKSAELWRMLFY
ncbi:metal-dependent hydrolase [Zhongshania sp.]|uniref:metal-dependent hydrolase n=1 Tax=Zhongshania sp. TaxID=1971902 RepID=UPI003568B4C9